MSFTVIGATSGIAAATAQEFASRGHALHLLGRTATKLREVEKNLFAHQTQIETTIFDLKDVDALPGVSVKILSHLDAEPYVLVAAGSLEEDDASKTDAAAAMHVIDVNFRNIVALLTPIVNHLEQVGKGTIILISSVAGERGRQSNYVYGASKAALTAYASGPTQSLGRQRCTRAYSPPRVCGYTYAAWSTG